MQSSSESNLHATNYGRKPKIYFITFWGAVGRMARGHLDDESVGFGLSRDRDDGTPRGVRQWCAAYIGRLFPALMLIARPVSRPISALGRAESECCIPSARSAAARHASGLNWRSW